MKTLIKHLFAIRSLRKAIIKAFVKIDNLSYWVITKLAVIDNGGVHPKHDILNYHQFFLDQVLPTDRVVDIGCGKGENAYDIAKKAKEVTGIDISENCIKLASKVNVRENLTYVQGDALTYDFKNKFDVIVLSNVLEHIDERVKFLKSIRTLAPKLLLRVPMITRDWIVVYKKNEGLEYRLDPTHYTEFTLPQLQDEIAQGGWQIDSYSVQYGEFWGVLVKK